VDSNASDRSPLIGLTTYVETARWGPWEERAALLPESYVQAVDSGGGLAVLLPPGPTGAAAVLARVDGLILTGGPDVDPTRYGEDPHPETGAPRTARDEWELALCRLALERDVPLLAICRGAQILNVACGGTLHQHLPEQVGHTGHRPAPGTMGMTDVAIDARSAVGRVLGTTVSVYCSHHQALDRVGAGLDVVGRAPDGTIEAVEIPGRRFAVGLQWHPEDDPTDRRIFAALVDAARVAALTQEPAP
jgi:gamma-glutamyl-gamma-aminobutyrate hydrolase PuuD